MRTLFAGLVAAAALASGCADDPPTVDEIADGNGCESIFHEQTREMFVRSKYDCVHADLVTGDLGDGSYEYRHTTLLIFHDNDARDSWREIAEHFGAVVLHSGDRWLEIKE